MLPPAEYGEKWRVVVDTSRSAPCEPEAFGAGARLRVPSRSLLVFDREV